ncbi:uncharacterized protein AB675_8142 [Cyphellophora attinorum]|uniref:BTB domain-containing protein n=1 Tax=Cyphellophora attinorum TaxID=1664694 RepID=A0A0N1P1N4_9EURO|nr:uncharacterized protein AB675_8142 [Phialophora attinorum]KPI41025.1 hypothetical protein AB675_8142 [Phialophora attinorum]
MGDDSFVGKRNASVALEWAQYATEETVRVVVGEDGYQVIYHLPPAALKAKSAYFRGCLSGSFKESEQNIITLDDVNPKTFAFFVQWLFSEKIWHVAAVDSKDARETEMNMIDLWILADRLLAEDCQNYCMDSIRATVSHQKTVSGCVKVIGKRVSAGGQLKAFYTQQMASSMARTRKASFDTGHSPKHESWLKELDQVWDQASAEATKDLFLKYMEERERMYVSPAALAGCHWHVHVDTSKDECEAKFRAVHATTASIDTNNQDTEW